MDIKKENDYKVVIDIDNIKEFYNLIYFNTYENVCFMDGFIFRGVSCSKYKLCPSVLRDTKLVLADQLLREATLLQIFYRICNDNGLKIPCKKSISDSYFTNITESKSWYKEGKDVWLDDDVLELAALAQHYGVPTRLLDWSQDINTAIYFATINAMKKINSKDNVSEKFTLWALNIKILQLVNKSLKENNLPIIPIRTIIPSYANNKNLCAQKGVLTSWALNLREAYKKGLWDEVVSEDTEELLVEYLDGLSPKGKVHNVLFQFNFSYSLIYDFWEYLNKINCNTAKMFPGYGGVANHIKDLSLFDFVVESSYSKNKIRL